MSIEAAYARCESITRAQARNFSYGIRLLTPDRRRALSAVYAFARRVDDIGDGELTSGGEANGGERRLAELATVREALRRLPERPGEDEVLVALADAARRFPIPLAAFEELIDGCEADLRGVRYDSFEDLVGYCRQVAGSIGRLSLGVFGLRPGVDRARASRLADELGVALQLTNILRDVREDRLGGRIYLPAKDLARFGCTLDVDGAGRFLDPASSLRELIGFEANRALDWYERGMALVPLLDRRSAACCAAMAGIYRRLLALIAADPGQALDHRMSLPGRQKAVVAVRALAGARV
jgi:phytoene synthase